jgi:hypothetical protein
MAGDRAGVPRSVLERAHAFLAANRSTDGGWPYVPGNPSSTEPTCYAAMVGSDDDRNVAIEWLLARLALRGQPDFQWENGLASLTLRRLNARRDVCERVASELVQAAGRQATASETNDLDVSLRGWSWVDGTFSWVEPTGYVLLALKANGLRDHPRVREAERLLLDRICADGGWNYGNRKILGKELDSMPPTTAIAAAALQGVHAASAAIGHALELLERHAREKPSSLGLALTAMCFDLYDRPTAHIVRALCARQKADGSWRRQVHLTALAALALQATEAGNNVFRI